MRHASRYVEHHHHTASDLNNTGINLYHHLQRPRLYDYKRDPVNL